MDELINRLSRYSKQCLAERLDYDFAHAIRDAIEQLTRLKETTDNLRCLNEEYYLTLIDCRNELCLKCGKHKEKHFGMCDGCRWETLWGVRREMTNGDKIRQMTDEELADLITDDWCRIACGVPQPPCDGRCDVKVLKWLKQEDVGDDER